MSDTARSPRPPLGVRLLAAVRREPDLAAMPPEELAALAEAQNRLASSSALRALTGFPARGTAIAWEPLELPGRTLRVRVHRPERAAADLPLVLHVHGGGFAGTATQCDWANSHLAARLPAVVASVDHRLVAPGVPMSAAVDDGWDALRRIMDRAGQWGVDPERTAVFGESAGAMIAAMAAIRARDAELPLRAQVLVNPCVDLTSTALDYASAAEHAHSPTLTTERMEVFRRLAVPEGADARAISPLYADDLGGLAAALVVVPALDPIADHGRAYAERLRQAGTAVRLSEHPRAGHAFLDMPRLVPESKVARKRITEFLRERLAAPPAA